MSKLVIIAASLAVGAVVSLLVLLFLALLMVDPYDDDDG